MRHVDAEVLIVGSGAGGATTAMVLAQAGHDVLVVEEGPEIEPGSLTPFGVDEMGLAYRHHGSSAALGSPPVAYAEGRCVGGSTEVNSGLWHRLPANLAEEWRGRFGLDEFSPEVLDGYADRIEAMVAVNPLPGPAPASSEVLERGATQLGWRSVEFPRAFSYDSAGRGTKQTMSRTLLPRAWDAGASLLADTAVTRLQVTGNRVVGAQCRRRRSDGTHEDVEIRADHVVVCGGAVQSPALLQRSGIRRGIGRGLKMHPTIKVAARFTDPVDHQDVPMHRITEFAPHLAIGGSASRRGHVALALADSGADIDEALADWRRVFVYYAAIRSDAGGRVIALPGMRAPLVTYRLTPGDLSRLARGAVHLGEALLAAGATELYPSIEGGSVVRRREDLVRWWDEVDRARASLMTVHLTSSIRMSSTRSLAGSDPFGKVWDVDNLYVNDASLLGDAPGVNPQAAIMTVALRNAEHLASTL
ncbi:MAG: GMC family oxidoreductase [Acidimicrobiales bacterium]